MPDDKFDELIGQDARVKRLSRMIPPTGPLPVQLRHEIRTALEGYMKEAGLSQSDVAEAIGQSSTYLSNLLTSAASLPEATRDRMLRDINNWLDREAKAREAERPADFVVTRVAERGMGLVQRLLERPEMAVATAPAGCGKTTVFEATVAEFANVTMIRAGDETRTRSKLLRATYNALSRRRRNDRRRVEIIEVVEKLRMPPRVKSANVLIIDQAHELPDGAFPVLMELHDRARCSILLVGTIDLRRRVSSDDDPELGQLSSRIGMRVNLAPELSGTLSGVRVRTKCFTVSDVRKLFHQSKVRLHSDAARMLSEIANTRRGTLRLVCRLFDWAEVAARKDGASVIEVKHIEVAAALVEEELDLPMGEVPPAAMGATA